MALRRVFLLRSLAPHVAGLSTGPQAREQPAASSGAVRAWRAAEAVRRPVQVVDFSNTMEAYRSRRSWELVRYLLVLRLCASPMLLAHHEQVRGWVAQTEEIVYKFRWSRSPPSLGQPAVVIHWNAVLEAAGSQRLASMQL